MLICQEKVMEGRVIGTLLRLGALEANLPPSAWGER
jgi:hypothetical protein